MGVYIYSTTSLFQNNFVFGISAKKNKSLIYEREIEF